MTEGFGGGFVVFGWKFPSKSLFLFGLVGTEQWQCEQRWKLRQPNRECITFLEASNMKTTNAPNDEFVVDEIVLLGDTVTSSR